ncbi:neutral zinc metallopeptidase [Nonomuraea sp. NPDC046802]|uniref:neutral zinc metallopeptidase n=1 Tax=Nonomuraea sp. NPDC046802 TaxID=3154919 RepID=UPI0033EE89CB
MLTLTLASTGSVLALADTAAASATPLSTNQQLAPQAAVASQQSAPKSAATANRIYKTGRLTNVNCTPGSLPRGSTAAYRKFLTRVMNCLNKAWSSQFRKAGMRFSTPRMRIVTSKVRTPCGRWNTGADAVYCSGDRTMYMMITKTQLRQPFALGITRLVAHEYGHHVQQVSGIWNYYWAARARAGKSTQLQLSRRSELQAECLSSVFMSTMRGKFNSSDWTYTVDWFRKNGAKQWPQNDHGRGPTQAAWMTRGYNSGSPGACNTWAASARSTL